MSKKTVDVAKSMIIVEVDPTECPFREFRDSELSPDYWGMGPAALRSAIINKFVPKHPPDYVWVDEQTQPLPRSVRQYLHGWIRAEDLAFNRWESEVVVFEENDGGKMSVIDIQLSHAQVLQRSSFCRRVLSACYMLERADGLTAEHQWENFSMTMAPDGWRARYHIYSPGTKPGGGAQHRPGLSKSGCYLVRLYYLGAWRCVWVSDQVPVDATESPLLPFSPLLTQATKPGVKQTAMVMSQVVHLWPLLLCKALLKLAAPDMNVDEDNDSLDDEVIPEFDMLHTLTGCMSMQSTIRDPENLWELIVSEVPVFAWDDDDDTLASTVKSKSTKKPTTKETTIVKRGSMVNFTIEDTKDLPPYALPGITPGHEMTLIVMMARDVPIKKPLPEPEVALWKYYRWVDWARSHGLYEAYDCPRTRFLRVNGLLKMSHAPHLLDVQSTESLTRQFREEHDKTNPPPIPKKGGKDQNRSNTGIGAGALQQKEELKEWVQYDSVQPLVKHIDIIHYPSMFEFTTAASAPPVRITKAPPNRALDIQAPKSAPLYLQIDGPDENTLKLSLNMLHPRVMFNCGQPVMEFIEPAYLILERFEWFKDTDISLAKAFVSTRGYDNVEVQFLPGRHFCRLWVHSRMNWHVALLSESALILGTRDVIQSAALRDCPWITRFLSNLGNAFINWIRVNRSNTNILMVDKEFYRSYQPDLTWDAEAIGYDKHLLHWMFRRALQSLLMKRLPAAEFRAACVVLRKYLCDPDFGLPDKPSPTRSVREIVSMDPCDCLLPEAEEMEEIQAEQLEEIQVGEEKPLVDDQTMNQLLAPPEDPIVSQVCELATEELPCGVLKEEREKVVKKHEAATFLQAHWRGGWARKCLKDHTIISQEVYKSLLDNAFGNVEVLSALMNEFFGMYPQTKYAFSVASGLSGVYGLQKHTGSSPVTPVCKWIPYFQGVFYCHAPVKVHFDVHSSLQYHNVTVYNNDSGLQLPQVYNAHITFDVSPNNFGYTVIGHGTLNQPLGHNSEVQWQLTVMTSINDVFHICDNIDNELCRELSLPAASKLHIDEIFIPNRRNILGGIQIAVTKHEAVSFRAAATSHDLEMIAILRTTEDGEPKELDRCAGKGELYWPYIRLKPAPSPFLFDSKFSVSFGNVSENKDQSASARSVKPKPLAKPVGTGKSKSATKLKGVKSVGPETKIYTIEVITPYGWPLTLAQWIRVDEVRNSPETLKIETQAKKPAKEKPSSAKDKDKDKSAPPLSIRNQPQPGDAYVELECSLAVQGGAEARRDDTRDVEFANARKLWDSKEPGRNLRGAQIRKEFRAENLEALPPPPSDSVHTIPEEMGSEWLFEGEESKKEEVQVQQGPTPASESGMLEMSIEPEEEAKYLLMPEQLKDKFVPLYFVPLCTREKSEDESVVLTPNIIEAAKAERAARLEAALERMRALQDYNQEHVLLRQKNRCRLLDRLFVDSQWPVELAMVLEERDEAIAREALNQTAAANKKKQETKVTKK